MSRQLHKVSLALGRQWAREPLAHQRSLLAARLAGACSAAHSTSGLALICPDGAAVVEALRCADVALGPCCAVLRGDLADASVICMLLNTATSVLKSVLLLAGSRQLMDRLAQRAAPDRLLEFVEAAVRASLDPRVAAGERRAGQLGAGVGCAAAALPGWMACRPGLLCWRQWFGCGTF